jgi:hypothetical protein
VHEFDQHWSMFVSSVTADVDEFDAQLFSQVVSPLAQPCRHVMSVWHAESPAHVRVSEQQFAVTHEAQADEVSMNPHASVPLPASEAGGLPLEPPPPLLPLGPPLLDLPPLLPDPPPLDPVGVVQPVPQFWPTQSSMFVPAESHAEEGELHD